MLASNAYSSRKAWKVPKFNGEFTWGQQNWRNKKKKKKKDWHANQAFIQDGNWANVVLVATAIWDTCKTCII